MERKLTAQLAEAEAAKKAAEVRRVGAGAVSVEVVVEKHARGRFSLRVFGVCGAKASHHRLQTLASQLHSMCFCTTGEDQLMGSADPLRSHPVFRTALQL